MKKIIAVFLSLLTILFFTSCNSNGNKDKEPEIPLNQSEAVLKAKTLGLGYGYNFIDKEYFDSNQNSVNSILDLDKLFNHAILTTQNANRTESFVIYEESISSFLKERSLKISSEVSLGAEISMYSVNVSFQNETSSKIEYSSYKKAGFLNCANYTEYKNYRIRDYGSVSNLKNYLSSNFLALINESGNLSDIAERILNDYGTHLIMGIKTGGRLDYFYSFATNNLKVSTEFKNKIGASAKVDVADIVSASANVEVSTELKNSLSSNETKHSNNWNFYGGSTQGINQSNIAENMLSWSDSINEKNALSIGVSSNGAISIVDIVACVKPALATALQNKILERADQAYRKMVAEFTLQSTDFSGGDGSEVNPYLISTASDFYNIRTLDDEEVYFKLQNDIDFDGAIFEPIDNFKGVLDGNNKTLKNYKLNITDAIDNPLNNEKENTVCSGLFAVNSGTIKNLKINNAGLNSSVSSTYSESNNAINNASRNLYAGLLVAINKGEIINVNISNVKFSILNDSQEKKGSSNRKLFGGVLVGANDGSINYSLISNAEISGFVDGRANWCKISCFIGGVCGENTANGKLNNIIIQSVNLESKTCGGCWNLWDGAGNIKSYAGYVAGSNFGCIEKSVVYDNKNNSLITTTEKQDYRVEATENAGLIVGIHQTSGELNSVFCISNNISNVVGNNNKLFLDCIKESVQEIYSYTMLWKNWAFENGKFEFAQ